MNDPQLEPEEQQTASLVSAALTGPTRPLRSDQIEALVTRAVQRLKHPLPPVWVLSLFALGLILITGLMLPGDFQFRSPVDLIWLLPLINLLTAPIGAYLILKKARQHKNNEE